MENSEKKYSHIKGWGIDADPENEPTYPMKNYTGDDHQRLDYEKAQQQEVNMEVLHSNERPGVTSVFGTSVPPSGLSGIIRRSAFRQSESSYGHWLPLLFADRINMIEGLFSDLFKGHIPNIFAERGWIADWKFDRKKLMTKVITGTVVITALSFLLFSKKGSKKKKYVKIFSR